MTLHDYKVIAYRQQDGSWIAEAPSFPSCYAVMDTKDEAIKELEVVFEMLAGVYQESGRALPNDTTQLPNA